MNPESLASGKKQLLAGLAAFLWLGLLAGGYFWGHQAFGAVVVTAVLHTIFNMLVWLALLWLCAALGLGILRRLRLEEEDAAARLIIAAGLGLGFLSLLFSFFGFVGLFRPLVAWLFIGLLVLVTWPNWRPLWQLARGLRAPRAQTNLQRLILVYGLVSLSAAAIMALTPVVAWDALTYQLVGPKLYIAAGRFVHPLNIPQLGFPLLGQMQFTLGMLLVGDGMAALFQLAYGLLALALVGNLARRMFSVEVAWWATGVLLTVPLFLTLLAWPYVDVALLFYTTAVFYAFYHWRQSRRTAWLLLLGIMLGLSGGLKYTAVATPIAVTLGLAWELRRDGLKSFVGRLALVGGVALALIVPWLLENWLTTGNPVYPFFLQNGLFWDAWRGWWYNRPGTGVLVTSPLSLLLAPLEASVLDATVALDAYDGTIGPFVLGALFLLPLVWGGLRRAEKEGAGWLVLFTAVAYGFWLWGIARSALLLQIRLLLPAFGLFALLSGLALAATQRWKPPPLAVDWLVRMVFGLALMALLGSQLLTVWQWRPLPVLVGLESETAYLRRTLGYFDEAMTAVNQLPPDAHVQFLWETRSYYCQVFCQPDPILDTWLHLTQYKEYSAADIAQLWQAEGVTHVLLNEAGLNFILDADVDPVMAADMAVWTAFNGRYLHALQTWPDAYTLYQFTP